MNVTDQTLRVLAIDPFSRGFGFAVLEGPTRLVDWGIVVTRGDKNKRALERLSRMLFHYRPGLMISENVTSKESRRSERVRRFLRDAQFTARGLQIKTITVRQAEVRTVMSRSGASTKEGIALTVSRLFPELAPSLPRHRKPWMSEDCRMQIFDAVALAVTYFYSGGAVTN